MQIPKNREQFHLKASRNIKVVAKEFRIREIIEMQQLISILSFSQDSLVHETLRKSIWHVFHIFAKSVGQAVANLHA